MKFNLSLSIFILVFCSIVIYSNPVNNPSSAITPLPGTLRSLLETGDQKAALKLIDSLYKTDPTNHYLQFLRGHIKINYGSADIFEIMNTLKQNGQTEYCDILNLQLDLLLGDKSFESKLNELKRKYPDSKELLLIDWLWKLDNGNCSLTQNSIDSIRSVTPFKFLPLLAAYYHSYDIGFDPALKNLQKLRDKTRYKFESNYQRLNALQKDKIYSPAEYELILEYAQCGAQPGVIMNTADGVKLKMALDTGTNGYGINIHNGDIGKKLQGKLVYKIENGIQYNYMQKPADVSAKRIDFISPEISNVLVEYFDGGLSIADGVLSPLIFGSALTIDPVSQTIILRNEQAINDYLNSMEKENYTVVPYKVRKGWIYLPCEVNGNQVMMMLETGSRDVNFNKIAVRRLGLESYESSVKWRGKDFPVTKVDTEIKIGDFKYVVNGGFVSDFVLGNLGYGLACAGDVGPDFIKNYIFTINPHNSSIILEKL